MMMMMMMMMMMLMLLLLFFLFSLQGNPSAPIQRIRLLDRIDARHAPEVRYRLGQGFAFVGLEGADEVPFYAAGQEGGFFGELLEVVLAEVDLGDVWVLMLLVLLVLI